MYVHICRYSINEISTWRRERVSGHMREQTQAGGKVGGGEEGDIDEEAETEERGIGQ